MTKKVKIPFVKQSPLVPMVRIFLPDGTGGWAIIDSGSESTLLDKEFAKKHKEFFKFKKTRDKINFVGIDSKSPHYIVNAKGDIAFYEDTVMRTQELEAILSDLSNVTNHTKENFDVEIAAIIGSDFLKASEAEVNYPDQALYINDDISGK